MGYKKLSNEQEFQLVQEYIDGTPVKVLMERYGFATKKSIMDKVKKYYPDNYKELMSNLKKLDIDKNKTYIIKAPQLIKEKEKFIPYILRGIIDGDGCVSPTSYGGAQFFIVTMSEEFANWIVDVLENKLYMIDIHKRQTESGIWRIETSNQYNILKLIALVYNKPFGMMRKYNKLRKTFRDYNNDALLDKVDGIVQTTTN